MSARAGRPLVARNAATLPSSLIDAEVFGNAKNYPNPGMAERRGLVGEADEGFLFLDELGELPLELQSHLLRVLDCGGEYQRLGESTSRRSDFRLLAATNRDLGQLRRDLVARLTLKIQLPALAERREDIPLLMRHLVLRAAEANPELTRRFVNVESVGRQVRFAPTFVESLLRHAYVGNTRELNALLWKAMGASDGDVIALPEGLRWESRAPSVPEVADWLTPAAARDAESSPERERILQTLAECGGNQSRAAERLGVSRRTLVRQIARLGVPRPRRPKD
jgi:DNA-binding NtrC family response regulator